MHITWSDASYGNLDLVSMHSICANQIRLTSRQSQHQIPSKYEHQAAVCHVSCMPGQVWGHMGRVCKLQTPRCSNIKHLYIQATFLHTQLIGVVLNVGDPVHFGMHVQYVQYVQVQPSCMTAYSPTAECVRNVHVRVF